ncbi:hypothetical protein TrST_g11638 [Triparma strigata]|uniref:Uncharacterized protein n=1 Tax=Triparma strigata TaxID=1606541 RepID=A0A9W7BFM3_9STRA|nr:hypothetical protein TrST_g11638 [Triparma strigata]
MGEVRVCEGKSLGGSIRNVVKHVNELIPNQPSPSTSQITFSLISTSYHLCNLNDIHTRSPSESTLNLLYKGCKGREVFVVFEPGVYPYREGERGFLAKCFLMCQELVPILVNVKGVCERKEFFQRSNFLTLSNIRRGLGEAVEEVGRIDGGGEVGRTLAGAVGRIGRVVDLVRPAGKLSGSVSMKDWEEAKGELEKGMERVRTVCDPDFGVEIKDWADLDDEF